jgi:LysR family transcriptional regulator, carnitine catabolism transcriptional activator
MSRIEQAVKGRTSWISIGTTPWDRKVLRPAIREFRERRPDLRIRLFDGNLNTITRPVASGKLDLGVGIFENTPGLRRLPFFRFR